MMKFWLSIVLPLLFISGARADNYRVVYSPSLSLEVWIDNVSSSDAQAWCQPTLPLRIVATERPAVTVLDGFLPQVGNLLQNQCSRLAALPWQLTDSQGQPLASGSALKAQGWRPQVNPAPAVPAASTAPRVPFPPADPTPLPRFALPGGCHFRTGWDRPAGALFVPADPALHCGSDGWLEGNTQLNLQQAGKSETLRVTFFQGYPLTHLQPAAAPLRVVSVNTQRMVLQWDAAPDSWLLLPFDAQHHLWAFNGTLLVKSTPAAAGDSAALKTRLESLQSQWATVSDPTVKIHVLLVDELHTDLADPAATAWRSVN